MGKGDNRRTENRAAVEANWPWPDPPRRHGRSKADRVFEAVDTLLTESIDHVPHDPEFGPPYALYPDPRMQDTP